MEKKIAFVTSAPKPDFAVNDRIVVDLLTAAGATVEAVPWDVDYAAWNLFDLVVIRSCWNYHLHIGEFTEWITKMEKQQIKILNPLSVARWNLHKNYLKELEEKGVALPETVWLAKGAKPHLADIMKESGWKKAVVKPAVSATAFNTFLVEKEEAAKQQPLFESLLAAGDMLVQKFMAEVQDQGEWSLIFFNKKFSHAVIKQPAKTDFRVQHDFGGTASYSTPPAFALTQAAKILELITEPLLYARVDGVIAGNKFLLMELELIEPMLFVEKENGSAQTFAKAIFNFIKNNN